MRVTDDGVVVLYGALRSGTTLVRLILDRHPDMCCPGERDFMLDFLQHSNTGFLLDRGALSEDRIFQATQLALPDTSDGATAFEAMLSEDTAAHHKARHVLVLHRGLDALLALRPGIKIIHIVRDPRDVARSSIGMGWAGNTWYGVDHWIATEREWEAQAGSLTPDQVFTLRYETLLQAPEDTLQRLFDFVGLPFNDQVFSFSAHSTYAPLDPALAEQWRRKQTPEELSDVEYKLGDLLTDRGYQPSGAVPRAPGALRRVQLFVQNKRHPWKTRFERFGYVDPIVETLTRRLKLHGLGHSARARMQEKVKQYLK